MLSTYRDVLALPGAARFSAAGFIARQPLSIVGLGIVIYIAGVSGSYAEAGLLAAAFSVPAALCALVTSRWLDRYGQSRLLVILALVHGLALLGFVLVVQSGLPLIVQAVTIALAGASQPAIGAMVRARWAFVVGRDGVPSQLRPAFALESLVDEIIFTIGPLLVTVLALQVALWSPLVLAVILTVGGSILLAAMHGTAPPPSGRPAESGQRRPAIREPGMIVAVVAALGLGFVFGSYEVTVVAFTQQAGQPSASGVILALWALGSLFGGLWFGSRHWRIHLPSQALICLGILTVVLIPATVVRNVPMLALVTFLGGAAVAPALISGFSLAERLVPQARLTEGLTWATSGLALGFSAGSAIGGATIDAHGTAWAFALPVLGAGTAAVAVALRRRHLLSVVRPYEASGPVAVPLAEPLPGPAPGTFIDDAR